MEIAQGTVSNCQHTINVSGGANNTSATTTYIALFRLDGRPVEFRASSPSSISDGDHVIAAGPMHRGALNALACHNVTTGEEMNSGLWGLIIGAVILAVIGFFGMRFATHIAGPIPLFVLAVLAAIMVYLIYRAVLTHRAIVAVRS